MASASSNLQQVAQWLQGLIDAADFTRAGNSQLLGEACLDRVCERCQERAIDEQQGADGGQWAENAPAYKKTKKKAGKIIGILSGEMLSDVQMLGDRTITPDQAVVVYGRDQAHRDRASYFQKGSDPAAAGVGPHSGAKNQPPRPGMFALDDLARQDVMDELAEYYDWLKTQATV